LLEVQPELGGRSKELRQPQGRIRCHGAAAAYNLVHPLKGDPKTLGELDLGHLEWGEELLGENFPRMRGVAVGWKESHSRVPILRSVVVGELDLSRAFRRPYEADPVLIIHPDAVLPTAVTLEGLKAVRRRYPEIVQGRRSIQQIEFAPCHGPTAQRAGASCRLGVSAMEDVLGAPIPEGEDHEGGIWG